MSPELKIKLKETIVKLMEDNLKVIDPNEGGPNPIKGLGTIIGMDYCSEEIVQWLDDVYTDMISSYRNRLEAKEKFIPLATPQNSLIGPPGSYGHTEKI